MLIGEMAGARSPARRDTALVGTDLALSGGQVVIPLDPDFEHALVVLEGGVGVDATMVTPGSVAYVAPGPEELVLTAGGPSRLLLLGGTPFESPITIWWNFVGRSRDELARAGAEWDAGAPRFGETGSTMARIPAPRPWWTANPGG